MKKKFLIGFFVVLMVLTCTLGLVACKYEHVWAEKWESDASGHWHNCTNIGCEEKGDFSAHSFKEHYTADSYWQECTVCGYIKGEAKHSFGLCKDDSGHWQECSLCGYVKDEANHSFELRYDDSDHWQECSLCGYVKDKESHISDNGDACDECNFVYGTKDLEFELNDDGATYKVTRLNSDFDAVVKEVIIPEYYKGKVVTVIGNGAFIDRSHMGKITLPKTIVAIEDNAFARCVALPEIVIPQSVERIGENVFESCNGITIKAEAKSEPAGWQTNDWQINQFSKYPVVWDCKNNQVADNGYVYFMYKEVGSPGIVKYAVKDGVAIVAKQPKIIDDGFNLSRYAHYDLNKDGTAESFDVVGIEDYAFYNFENLSGIDLFGSYTFIGNHAFEGCTSLSEVIWLKSDKKVSIGDCAFLGAIRLETFEIPENLYSLGAYAFGDCAKLSEVILSLNVKEVGKGAFENCSSTLVIKCEAATIPEGWNAEWNISNCHVIWDYKNDGESGDVYESGLATYILDHQNKTAKLIKQEEGFYTDIEISRWVIYEEEQYEVTEIGDNVFKDATYITSVKISGYMKKIGASAFAGCTNLQTITFDACKDTQGNPIEDSRIEQIGASAFADCTALESIVFNGEDSAWEQVAKGNNWDSNTGEFVVTFA